MSDYRVSVLYDGKSLIPGPYVGFTRKIERSADGRARQRGWTITVKGKAVAFKGSPDNDGNFWTGSGYPADPDASSAQMIHRIANLRSKMRAISNLFSNDGKWFEIIPGDGTAPIRAQPRNVDIQFAEGPWINYVQYTITMDADCVHFGTAEVGDDDCALGQDQNPPEETWSLEQADDIGRTYRLQHTVVGQGKQRFDDDGTVLAEGWEVARDLVLGGSLAGETSVTRLGFQSDKLVAVGVLGLTSFLPYNYTRTQNIDEGSGRFTVNEAWLCFDPTSNLGDAGSGVAIEDLMVDTRYSTDSGMTTVSVSGTVTGLEERDSTTREFEVSRYDNAVLRFADLTGSVILARAQDASGVTLNPAPASTTVGRNKVSGVITYAYEYNTRPALSDGSFLSENYDIAVDNANSVIAELAVMNRPEGPIFQDPNTVTRKVVAVTASIVLRASYGSPLPAPPSIDPLALVAVYLAGATQVFLAGDKENWNERNGRYSRVTSFLYQ